MTSIYRYRERDLRPPGNSGSKTIISHFTVNGAEWSGYPTTSTQHTPTLVDGYEECQDRITTDGQYEPNDLTINKRWCEPASLSGSYSYPSPSPYWGFWYEYVYNGYFNSRLSSPFSTGLKTYVPETHDYWLANFLARESLTKPVVDVPLFLWELREFPRLLRHLGDTLSAGTSYLSSRGGRLGSEFGTPSDHWLAFHFGWKPLISDVMSLLNFSTEVEKRLAKLRSARSREHVYRLLYTDETRHHVGYATFETVGIELFDRRTVKVWGTGKWETTDHAAEIAALLGEGPTKFVPKAMRMYSDYLGLRINASTFWNALPWSWLIDYFTNIGDVLESRRHMPAQMKDVSIMISDHVVESSKVISNPNKLKFIPHKTYRVSKTRRAYLEPSATPRFRPILDWNQTSMLAALVTAPRLRRVARTL